MVDEKIPRLLESDDVARARAFWKGNGKPIVFGIGLGLAGIAGLNFWEHHKQSQGEQASSLYQQVLEETADARIANETLKTEFGNTVYAVLGAIVQARMFVEDEDYGAAIHQLEWAIENSEDESVRHVARQRLALVYLANDEPQSAIDLLAIEDMGNFEARYQEILGDAFMQRQRQGDSELARSAWQSSLDKTLNNETDKELLQMKLQNIGDTLTYEP